VANLTGQLKIEEYPQAVRNYRPNQTGELAMVRAVTSDSAMMTGSLRRRRFFRSAALVSDIGVAASGVPRPE
jgi:hypothetical protein